MIDKAYKKKNGDPVGAHPSTGCARPAPLQVNLTRGSAPPRPTPAALAVPAVGEDLAGSTRVLDGAGRPGDFIVADEGFEGPFGHWVGRGGVLVGPARARVPVVARLWKAVCGRCLRRWRFFRNGG